MEDSTKIESQEQRNTIIHQLISIIEKNGDTLYNEFFIRQNEKEEFEFTIDGSALTRFKKNVFTYLLDNKGNFKEGFEKYKDATAAEVYEFLRNGTGDNYTDMFGISDEYTVEETLKIMGIRYTLFCNYPK
jgi:penicillin-binding protein 2